MALQDNVRNLAMIPILRELGPDALRLLAFSADTRILRAGDVLFRHGDVSDAGFVVLSGAIALDAETGPVTIVRAGMLIGESALVTETTRGATALARAPSSVLRITRALFHKVLSEFPESAARLHRILTARLVALRGELESLGRSQAPPDQEPAA